MQNVDSSMSYSLKCKITRLYLIRHEQKGVFLFLGALEMNEAHNTFRYFTSSPSKACSDISML